MTDKTADAIKQAFPLATAIADVCSGHNLQDTVLALAAVLGDVISKTPPQHRDKVRAIFCEAVGYERDRAADHALH
jgi:thiaminase